MNREEVISLAEEALSIRMEDKVWTMSTTHLEHLANAIANNQRAKLALWMMSQGYSTGHGDSIEKLLEELEWQIEERIRNAREECAKVCEELLSRASTGDEYRDGVADCIAAIRARGEK
jgi:formate-dependent phosphoribosylglycinamide formyltransferase (GAR transformylase)